MEFCKAIKHLAGESDWPIWKRKVRDIFEFYEGALDVVDEKLVKPEPIGEEANEAQRKEYKKKNETYRKANSYAKSVITSTITDDIYQKVMDRECASEMWKALKQQFEATAKDQVFKMCTELFSFQWSCGDDVSTHISKLKNLFNEINNGLKLKREHPLPDLVLVCKILYILPSSYEVFKSSWMMLTRDGDKTLDELIMQLCLYERNLKRNVLIDSDNQEALVASNQRMLKAKKSFKTKSDDFCHYCKKKGHWLRECRKWLADGKPSRFQKGKIGFSNVALQSIIDEASSVSTDIDWWVDNGATKHVTRTRKYFVEYESFNDQKSIQAAGKEILNAEGKGTIEFLSRINQNLEIQIRLEDVWYVPGISRNLFSVLAAHDRNRNSEFKSFPMKCQFNLDGKKVLTGNREVNGCLYKANITPISPFNGANAAVYKPSLLQLYHERWGHQNKEHVRYKLQRDLGITVERSIEVCEPCIYGKYANCHLEGVKLQHLLVN
ncbi:Retrovirus-related Pol polyprotein from transposon TNT 1-94 [Eumeta japonica]|uniref:Retrovirus-related Pol polyprotein from transposon TNT 1-94 n=1 Tax=Eumeta variegata TaxID=151549 RepID=A0A4C1TCT1_EUMVA|nr:Retrovirus-related Pol polyprotein from transposon TNT 1-94 [Eumeta japonica]